jgi:hypothetical protein
VVVDPGGVSPSFLGAPPAAPADPAIAAAAGPKKERVPTVIGVPVGPQYRCAAPPAADADAASLIAPASDAGEAPSPPPLLRRETGETSSDVSLPPQAAELLGATPNPPVLSSPLKGEGLSTPPPPPIVMNLFTAENAEE